MDSSRSPKSILYFIFKDSGVVKTALAPYYLNKSSRSRLIDFNFFWLCSFSLMDLLAQSLLLGQTFRGDSFSGRLETCQIALSLAHFSRIMISIQIFLIACYRLNIMTQGLTTRKRMTKKLIDKIFCFQILGGQVKALPKMILALIAYQLRRFLSGVVRPRLGRL